MRSLRSRLVVGMLVGMSALLAAAGSTIYTVQRRELYRAFDDTLLGSANALALLLHPGPFGYRLDAEGLARLPAGQIREGALYQLWSDQPIDTMSRPRWVGRSPDDGGPRDEDGPPEEGRPPGDMGLPGEPGARPPEWDDRPPPKPESRGRGPRPDGFGRRPPLDERELWRGRETGELVVRSASLEGADLPRLEVPGDQPRFEMITLPSGVYGRAVGVRFRVLPVGPSVLWRPPAEVLAVVAADAGELEQHLRFLGVLLAATALGTMAFSVGVAWLAVSRGLRPLATVAQKIGGLDETGLKQRLADGGVPPEIEPVIRQLNGLLGRLDEAFDRERTLTADVAHELRTPVAEIRTIAEITLSRVRDAEEYRQALSEALEAIRTLQALIEKLLVLARLEAGQTQVELQPVPVVPVLGHLWRQVGQAAEARGVTFEDQCGADDVVCADQSLLEVVVSNALSNAAAYTPDGGRITVLGSRRAAGYELSLANTGCTLSRSEVPRVFDRFWRSEAARSRTGLNCGLGLTLVRRAMEAMGGQAEATVSHEGCFVLTLTFTAVDASARGCEPHDDA